MAINPKPDIKGYAALRHDLIHLADETNKIRLQLIEVQKEYSRVCAELIMEADRLWRVAQHEYRADGELKPEFKPDTDVETVAEYSGAGNRRKCGLCGEPGHRAPTCPNAHKVQEEKKEKVEKKTERKERAAALPKGKRACSICRKPGHRAQNCPEQEDA